jgi:hypothetical protein
VYRAGFKKLLMQFELWAGRKWLDTPDQRRALAVEARKLGIPVVAEKRSSATRERGIVRFPERKAVTWRHEVVTVRSHSQDRYRDLRTGRFIRRP